MKITWFGRILIDPFLSGNPTFEGSGLKVHDARKGSRAGQPSCRFRSQVLLLSPADNLENKSCP